MHNGEEGFDGLEPRPGLTGDLVGERLDVAGARGGVGDTTDVGFFH